MKSIQIAHFFYSTDPFLLCSVVTEIPDLTKRPLSQDGETRKTRSVWEQRGGAKAAIPAVSTLIFHPPA